MTPTLKLILDNAAVWITKAKAVATARGLDPVLVCAVIEQESMWNNFAVRPESESGFMQRYGATYIEIVRKSASKNDDKWIKFEDLFYCSYGLMQTMYCVVIETFPEATAKLTSPNDLCNPDIGLEYGVRLLSNKIQQAGGDVTKGLLHWNGGGNPKYAEEVLARRMNYQ